MQRRFFVALMAAGVVAAAVSSTACSSSSDSPAAFTNPDPDDLDEKAELQALEIGDDEPIIDEGNIDSETANASDLQENPLQADEAEAAQVQILSDAPAGQPVANIKNGVWKCPGSYAGTCACEGSPLNCQFPNAQPGRNRYLPPGFVAEVEKRNLSFSNGDVTNAGRWAMKSGQQIYDGQGTSRGVYKSPCESFSAGGAVVKDDNHVCAMINFGQMLNMKADGDSATHTFVYAFSVDVPGSGGVSGWIHLDDAADKADLVKMGSHKARAVSSLGKTSYVLKSALDWNQKVATFDADKLPAWSKAGVGLSSENVKPLAGHYLLRPGNVINLIYSTPGVGGAATDTFTVAPNGLAFRRAISTHARPTLVRIRVEDKNKPTMIFAYGSILGRFGWMALASIKKGTVDAAAARTAPAQAAPGPAVAPTADVCSGKADGTYCDTIAIYGYTCSGGAVSKALQCPEDTTCVGPSADGASLVCM